MQTDRLHLPPEEEIEEEFLRTAGGPGGQNVNKTSTAVRLVYRFQESSFLPAPAKERLKTMLGGKELVSILAREYRSLQDNRRAARIRLSALLDSARKEPKKRKPTKPTRASRKKRLEEKSRRSELKAGRRAVFD